MRTRTRTLIALAGATALLGALIGTASANRLSSNPTRSTVTWSSLEFVEPLGSTVRCPVTLESSLHSATIAKVAGALIGHVFRASLTSSSCSGIHATILRETLPWHLQYSGFEGTLPNITAVRLNIIGFAIRIEGTFGTCLFRSTTTQPFIERYNLTTSHAVTSVAASSTIASTETCGPFGERVTGGFRGTSTTNTAQTVILI